jgi:hypothetical protein
VLSPGTRGPIPCRVRLDGEPPGPSHGIDVDEDGHGLLREPPDVPAGAPTRHRPRRDAGDRVPSTRG